MSTSYFNDGASVQTIANLRNKLAHWGKRDGGPEMFDTLQGCLNWHEDQQGLRRTTYKFPVAASTLLRDQQRDQIQGWAAKLQANLEWWQHSTRHPRFYTLLDTLNGYRRDLGQQPLSRDEILAERQKNRSKKQNTMSTKNSKKAAIETAQAAEVSAPTTEMREMVIVSPWGKKSLPVAPKGAKQYVLTAPDGTAATEDVKNLHLAVGMKGSIQFLDGKGAGVGDLHQTDTTKVYTPVATNTATPPDKPSGSSKKPTSPKGGGGGTPQVTLAGTIDRLADGSLTAQEMAEHVASIIGIPVEKALRDVYGRVNWKNKKLGREELLIKGGNERPASEQPRKAKVADVGHVVAISQPGEQADPATTEAIAKAVAAATVDDKSVDDRKPSKKAAKKAA